MDTDPELGVIFPADNQVERAFSFEQGLCDFGEHKT